MAQCEKPNSLEELDERLQAARHRRDGTAKGESSGRSGEQGLGTALRIGVDLVAAIGVGVGIGLLLDHWLDTKPWFLIGFFLLGAAAGIVNVVRVASGYGLAAGYKKSGD
jgi:ATP synthase protein I